MSYIHCRLLKRRNSSTQPTAATACDEIWARVGSNIIPPTVQWGGNKSLPKKVTFATNCFHADQGRSLAKWPAEGGGAQVLCQACSHLDQYSTSKSQYLDNADQRGPQRSHLGILSPFNLITRAHRERRSFARPLKPRPPSAAKAGEFM